MDPRLSIKVYPRLDQKYKLKGSLNYDLLRTKIFREQEPPKQLLLLTYVIYALIAFSTAVVGICIVGI